MNLQLATFFSPQDLLLLILIFMFFVFPLWMLIDCIKHETSEGNTKLIWVLVIILAPFGSPAYFFVRKLARPKSQIKS